MRGYTGHHILHSLLAKPAHHIPQQPVPQAYIYFLRKNEWLSTVNPPIVVAISKVRYSSTIYQHL